MKRNLLLTALAVALITACASDPSPAARPASKAPAVPEARQEPVPREQSRATEALNRAKSIKADVEYKEEFEAAQALFDEAESLKAVSEEKAAEKYIEAEARFKAAYETAAVKRDEALRQLDIAQEAIKSVEDAVRGEGAE
jgi:predicted lipoprotein